MAEKAAGGEIVDDDDPVKIRGRKIANQSIAH
jgi:hypothetical protein